VDKATARIAARTRVAAAAHRRPQEASPPDCDIGAGDGHDGRPLATVIPFGIFDADAESDRWP
jgi:hypothetical protein